MVAFYPQGRSLGLTDRGVARIVWKPSVDAQATLSGATSHAVSDRHRLRSAGGALTPTSSKHHPAALIGRQLDHAV